MICKICKQEMKNVRSLVTHVSVMHKIKSKDYYDTYLKKENEGLCKVCGTETKFRRFSSGYCEYCSVACMHESKDVKEKRQNTIDNRTDEERHILHKRLSDARTINYDKEKRDTWIMKIKTSLQKNFSNEEKRNDILNRYRETRIHNNINKLNEKLEHCRIISKNDCFFECHCNICNEDFKIHTVQFYRRLHKNEIVCTLCNESICGVSKDEKQICEFIKIIYNGDIIENSKNILPMKKELDIYIPEKKLAIEFDGLYWHNELYKDKNYHLWKTEECEKQGIQLIHIFEDEWLEKDEIVKSRIKGLLGLNERIFARNTECKEITYKESKEFLDMNHIQGNCVSKYRYGLFHNNELVAAMTFGESRFKLGEFELLRFANKLNTNIIGGASKLFKHFLNDHPEITEVVSYADRRWSKGNLYEKLNFTRCDVTKPNYFYVNHGIRESRMKYQKHKLNEKYGESKDSERAIMAKQGFFRIYDCGNIKFIYGENKV